MRWLPEAFREAMRFDDLSLREQERVALVIHKIETYLEGNMNTNMGKATEVLVEKRLKRQKTVVKLFKEGKTIEEAAAAINMSKETTRKFLLIEGLVEPRNKEQFEQNLKDTMWYIRTHLKDHEESPTIDEIAHSIGMSPESARVLVLTLENRGLIRYRPNKPRSIVPVDMLPKSEEVHKFHKPKPHYLRARLSTKGFTLDNLCDYLNKKIGLQCTHGFLSPRLCGKTVMEPEVEQALKELDESGMTGHDLAADISRAKGKRGNGKGDVKMAEPTATKQDDELNRKFQKAAAQVLKEKMTALAKRQAEIKTKPQKAVPAAPVPKSLRVASISNARFDTVIEVEYDYPDQARIGAVLELTDKQPTLRATGPLGAIKWFADQGTMADMALKRLSDNMSEVLGPVWDVALAKAEDAIRGRVEAEEAKPLLAEDTAPLRSELTMQVPLWMQERIGLLVSVLAEHNDKPVDPDRVIITALGDGLDALKNRLVKRGWMKGEVEDADGE